MTDRIALVTGASSGIGKASAIALAAAGFKVGITGRRADALDEVAGAIAATGGTALPLPADVTDPDAVAGLFDRVVSEYGRLDVIFNNAGVSAPESEIEDVTYEDWMRVVQTNLTGVFLCMQHAFRVMKAQSPQGGRVINNGSISAYMPRPMAAAYTATKHGVLGLTRQGALDGRRFDIAVGQIDIGNAATEMTERMTGGVTQADFTKAAEPRIHLDDVSAAVVYMAGLPLSTNVLTINVMATGMPFVGRG